MKIQIVSDLHCEFYRDGGAALLDSLDPAGTDVLVVAGDMASGTQVQQALERLSSRFRHTVYLPGNHEFYRQDALEMEAWLRALTIPGVSILNPGLVTIDGVRFAGAPLWFGPLSDEQRRLGIHRMLNDFNHIRRFEPWVYEKHAEHRQFLSEHLDAEVIVTHHLPAIECIDPMFAGLPLNHFFHAQADDLVARCGARLWIHGHTHSPVDVRVGKVRIVANPKGYPREQHTRFNPHLILEI
jgi:predicted phosphodiesterase